MNNEIRVAAFDFVDTYGKSGTESEAFEQSIEKMKESLTTNPYLKQIDYDDKQRMYLEEFTERAARIACSMGARLTVTGCETRSVLRYTYYMPHRPVSLCAFYQFSHMKQEVQAMEIGPLDEKECILVMERPLFLKMPDDWLGVAYTY